MRNHGRSFHDEADLVIIILFSFSKFVPMCQMRDSFFVFERAISPAVLRNVDEDSFTV